MTDLEPRQLDVSSLHVLGMLCVLGAIAYAAVWGAPLVAGGLAVAFALIAYRRVYA